MTLEQATGFLLVGLALFWALLLLWSRPRDVAPRHKAGPSHQEKWIPVAPIPTGRAGGEAELWRGKLMVITRGNTGAIQRGLAAGRRKFPQASEAELLQRLYEEYLRDQ